MPRWLALVLVLATSACAEYRATSGATFHHERKAVRSSAHADVPCRAHVRVERTFVPGEREEARWKATSCGVVVRYRQVPGGFGVWQIVRVP